MSEKDPYNVSIKWVEEQAVSEKNSTEDKEQYNLMLTYVDEFVAVGLTPMVLFNPADQSFMVTTFENYRNEMH